MSEDNITPAVKVQQDEMPNEMSAAEFQQRLYSWFEDRGLLSELRAHLRKQMIGVLKDTAIGRTVSGQQKQVSPKLQALNLLIAEFLLQQEYHYSLSVFSTEVPLISVLPEFPGLTMNCSTSKTEDGNKWQFSEKDMWDILETLGVQRDTDEAKSIFNAYYQGIHKEPLLTCIVRMLHAIKSKSRTSIISETKEPENAVVQSLPSPEHNNSELWLKTVSGLLSSSNVSAQSSEEIVSVLKRIIDAEKKRLREEVREEFVKLQMVLQLQTARKEEEQQKKLSLLQKNIDSERGKLDSERSSRQFKINEFEQRVQRHREVLRERYQALHIRERDLHERDQQLRHREGILDAQQHNLGTGYENLYREQRTVSDLQEKLQRELREKQKAAKNDVEFLRDLQEECKNMRNQITSTQEAVLNVTGNSVMESQEPGDLDGRDTEQALVKGLIRQLQIENSGLRTLNSEQQFRIDELSQRAALLMNDLENSQTAAAVANRLTFRNTRTLSAPPLDAPNNPAATRYQGSSNSGAGEEGYRPTLPTSPTEFRHYPNVRDAKRRVPPRRLTIHSSSSSDDHSPTNDVLQEARERLKRLERESEEVDRHYRQFRSRQAHVDHHFYQRNSNLLQSFGSSMASNGESSSNFQNQQPASSSNFNPDAMSHMFVKYQTLHGNADEPCGSQSVSRSHCPECPGNSSTSGNNDAQCCSNLPLNQRKRMDLSQLVEWHFNQAISCMTNNESINDLSLQRENQQKQKSAEESKKEEKETRGREEEPQLDNQSIASSGILGEMLAAGTSGVSLSDVEASDEKSESQPENLKD